MNSTTTQSIPPIDTNKHLKVNDYNKSKNINIHSSLHVSTITTNKTDSIRNDTNTKKLTGKKRFEIKKQISDTLQGRIYLAKDSVRNKKVVVKEAWKHLVQKNISRKGRKTAEDFIRERQLLISLSKKKDFPNSIIKCIATWNDRLCYYYVMQFCQCELFDYISKHFNNIKQETELKNKLQLQIPLRYPNKWVQNITHIFHQICTAVEWLHLNGYCHCDLSLENIMIYNMNKLSIKVIDLGLTKPFNNDKNSNCLFKGRIGKSEYMSPETFIGLSYNGKQNDVYCLGVMLYLMLIGSKPYKIPNENNDIAFKHIIHGDIEYVLKQWNKLTFVTENAIDLLVRMLTYEKTRISLNDAIKHPFFNVLNRNKRIILSERGRQRPKNHNCNDNRNRSRSRSRNRHKCRDL